MSKRTQRAMNEVLLSIRWSENISLRRHLSTDLYKVVKEAQKYLGVEQPIGRDISNLKHGWQKDAWRV